MPPRSYVEPMTKIPAEYCGLMPHARPRRATIVSQRQLAEGTYSLRLDCPELAASIVPGQFFMVRPATGTDPLLGRPFALYDTILTADGKPHELEFAYHVVGKATRLFSELAAGIDLQVWGPLGNGFPAYTGRHLLCVGGGIGYTPFLAVARETRGGRCYGGDVAADRIETRGTAPARVTLCYGAQSQKYSADLSDFESIGGIDILRATDDGSLGHHGFVTDLVRDQLARGERDRPDGVYCCGPEPMMHACARICEDAGVACWLSLETPMACGFGACFSCVTRIRTADEPGWDYRRTCIEGPIFRSDQLYWPETA